MQPCRASGRQAASIAPLSARLEAVLGLLLPCRMLVDVGTDHGLVPIAAVRRGVAQRAIASDLRDAPLVSARQNIADAGLSDRVVMLKSHGLSALAKGSVDAVVLAGMSGEQIVRLCEAAPHVLDGVSQLLVQPNSDVVVVRAWALSHGWHLRDERMVSARGRFPVVCAFRKAAGVDPAYELHGWSQAALCLVGPALLARKDAATRLFAEWQCQRLGALVEQDVHGLRRELEIWQAARAFLEGKA